MGKAVFRDERSFLQAWETGLALADPALFGKSADRGTFYDAAERAGKAMADQGFRLFRNGGLPLMERRVDELRQEIILQPAPNSIQGVYEPLVVKVHVSHAGVKEVRGRYWIGGGRAPGTVASGHLGLVADPPCFVLWDVADGPGTADELASWVSGLATGWFEHFDSLDTLTGDVLLSHVPMVSTADVLELVLAEKGRDRAKRYLREIIEFGATLSPRTAPLTRVDEGAPVISRLDAIATSYRLR